MKKRSLYLDCHTGISGDMVVAALLDAGADREVLETVLRSIPVSGFEIAISRVQKAAIGRINDEQLLKLRTLGLTEEEAESVIIENFLN